MLGTAFWPSFSDSCAPPRTVELDDVDVVDSRTESSPFPVSHLALLSPKSFKICPILPDRLRVTGGLFGLCVLCRNPGGGNPGECEEIDEGDEAMLKLLGDSFR